MSVLRCMMSNGNRSRRFKLPAPAMLAFLLVPGLAFGQWIHHPTAGLPRKADGTLNGNAPAPRGYDGKPDFSGIWHTALINQCQPETGLFCGPEIGGSPLALDIGKEMANGLPYQAWAKQVVSQRTAKDDPHVRCLPDNPPRAWVMPHLIKAVHTPKLLVLLYEVNAMYRQIFIDGRDLPEDQNPTWNGYSISHWEDDTLVVTTAGFRDEMWIDMGGALMSSKATMTERIRRPNFGTLDIEITIDDPSVYTRPWTVLFKQELMADTELMDEFCLENERSWEHMVAEPKK